MKETAMHFPAAIVFAGIAGLALAALHEPAQKPTGSSAREIELSGNMRENHDNIADDWRFSIHESIREQTRAQLRARTRQGLQISRERIAFSTRAEPDSGLASLHAFQLVPGNVERMLPE